MMDIPHGCAEKTKPSNRDTPSLLLPLSDECSATLLEEYARRRLENTEESASDEI